MRYYISILAIVYSFTSFSQVVFRIDGSVVDQTQVQTVQLLEGSPDYSNVELTFENSSAGQVDWLMNQCMLLDDPNIVGIDLQWGHENDQFGGIHFIFGPTAVQPCWDMPMNTSVSLASQEKTIAYQGFEVFGGGCELHRYYIMETGVKIDSIDINFCSTLSITENNKAQLSVYPNPANENITVDYSGTEGSALLFSVQGELLFEEKLNSDKTIFDVSSFCSGVYLLKILSKEEVVEVKKLQID